MSLRLWLQAARPRTLTGAAAPVIVGLSSAWHESGSLRFWPALGCLLFALLMQIDANLFNDWWDCRKGVDTRVPRLGPVRLCAAGLIPMRSMQRAVVLVTVLSALVGLTLFWHSFSLETQMPLGLPAPLLMLLTGAACLLSFAAYSTFFSRLALGDVLVVVFFGLVPVVCTCLLQDVAATPGLWRQAFAMGLATDALLVVNNYRDREGDRLTGKLTLCTLIGPRLSRALYLLLGVAAAALAAESLHFGSLRHAWTPLLLLFYLALHTGAWLRLRRLEGTALNGVLAATAQGIFVFSLILAAILW